MTANCDLENLLLTARPGTRAITDEHVATIWAALDGRNRIRRQWLCEGEAWHAAVKFRGLTDAIAAKLIAADVLSGLPVDINVTRNFDRTDTLLVADMESTIIEQELIDELAGYAGHREEIAAITLRTMRGEIDFETSLQERVARFKGMDARVLDEIYEHRVTLMPGAATLIATMRAQGAHCALVSGGFSVFAGRLAQRLGFDSCHANVLEIEAGRLTGRVKEPILGRAGKRAILERLAREHTIPMAETIAAGDGANDLDMLAAAGIGVAFRAKPKVQEAVRALPNGAVINHGDLTALLYLQGYRQDEFATLT